jgi:hypothetical protein
MMNRNYLMTLVMTLVMNMMTPNGTSERQEAKKYWFARYKKSVSACTARTNLIRVNNSNCNDTITGGVAIMPDLTFSHQLLDRHDTSVSPGTNHGNTNIKWNQGHQH